MSRLPRRLAVIVLTASVGLAPACSSSNGEADPNQPYELDVAVLAANEYYSIPWLVGQDQGFFETRGVKVNEIVAGSGGSATLRTQLSGDLPIGEVGYNSVLDAAEEGVPIIAVGGAVQNPYGGEFYAFSTNDEVNGIDDIESWAYTNPGSSIYALSYMVPTVAGVSTDAERVAAGGVGEGVALLEAGEVDVAWIPPTLASRSEDKFKLVVSTSEHVEHLQSSVITTSPEFAESHPEVVKAVLAGYQEAIAWLAENPEGAAQIYADYVDVPLEVALDVVNNAIAANAWNVGFTRESLETGAEAAKLSGFEGDIAYCDLFDVSYLPEGADAELPADCPRPLRFALSPTRSTRSRCRRSRTGSRRTLDGSHDLFTVLESQNSGDALTRDRARCDSDVRHRPRSGARRPRRQTRRIRLDRRPQRLRQVDAARARCGTADSDVRIDQRGRSADDRTARAHRHHLPGFREAALAHRRRQRGLPIGNPWRRAQGATRTSQCPARQGGPCWIRAAPSRPAVGRNAPESRDGPRADHGSRPHPGRRAIRRPRRADSPTHGVRAAHRSREARGGSPVHHAQHPRGGAAVRSSAGDGSATGDISRRGRHRSAAPPCPEHADDAGGDRRHRAHLGHAAR